jgi:hydroxymethylpyrimidine/phosphomethylpyrimidine kinase
MTSPAVALTIAGSDSGGCAGIQADLKAMAANGVFGASAITALTAQNTTGVQGVHPIPVDFIVEQINSVVDDLRPSAVKTGMLATSEIIEAVADLASTGRLPNLVVDPVMVATSGDRLLAPEAEAAYLEKLLPLAAVITPNGAEAEALTGAPVRTVTDAIEAAKTLGQHCDGLVVVKGGHVTADEASSAAVDIVWDGTEITEITGPWIDTKNTHGTGCSFAAAVAAHLAKGSAPIEAVRAAKTYVAAGIAGGATWDLGQGSGPIDHFGWSGDGGGSVLREHDQ